MKMDDVLEMDLKQLMQMDVVVTSVSKRPQKLHEAASAIFVVTQEDIRRTGATTIMEALRIVPGLLVSRVDQNNYAISSRGFNERFISNRLLVLIDGRSVYNPNDAGVPWVRQDTVLEDIERIEVIRGPGAALWGSNAVDGVINIITKSSSVTQGILLSGGAGTEERGFGTLRYGGKVRETLSYRVYGKYRDRDDGKRSDGTDSFDDKQMYQGGFRSDWQINPKDQLTLQGDYYESDIEKDFASRFNSYTPPFNIPLKVTETISGGNFITHWNRVLENDSDIKFRAYYDRVKSKSAETGRRIIDQADLDFQHDFRLGKKQNISWGLNYRFVSFNQEDTIRVVGTSPKTHRFGFFIHDEITLIPQKWNLILGSKFSHNQFSGFEVQPNIRTVWTPHPKHTLWAAISRAVRIPSLGEDSLNDTRAGFVGPGSVNVVSRIIADGRTNAEDLLAYEVGYRTKISPEISLDIAAYMNQYDNLTFLKLGTPFPEAIPAPAHLVSPLIFESGLEGESYGVELNAEWKPFQDWLLAGSYSYNQVDIRSVPSLVFPTAQVEDEPNHLFNIRSYLALPFNLEFDTLLYFVSSNKARNLDSYTRLDLRVGWKPTKKVEFSLVGQNLLEEQHREFTDNRVSATETQRSFYAKATFRFK